ncbi:MAG TPA: hypothetical protein VG537_07485 [Candidatus Kapabacteria bacterium]|nr:hypothetical protein [Candidatus Kapabacteria bacterium]
MIDLEKLKYADIEVANSKLTPEDKKEISEFLKAHRAKHADSKKVGRIPRPPRKANARVKK